MTLGTRSTHWEGPHVGGENAQGGLCDEVPVDLQSRRFTAAQIWDFLSVLELSASEFSATHVGTPPTMAVANPPVTGGVIRFTSTANGDTSHFISLANAYVPSTTDTLSGLPNPTGSFGIRISISDYSNVNWCFGLAGFDSTTLDPAGALLTTGGDNFVGFHHIVDATAQGGLTGPDGNNVRLVSAGTAVANYEATLLSAAQVPLAVPTDVAVDGVFIEYGVRLTGTRDVEWYRNGVLRHRRRAAVALSGTVALVPMFAIAWNGALVTADIDYLWTACSR